MTEHRDMPPRKLTLGEARQRASQLRDRGMTYVEIGAVLGVPAIRARDLCRQYDRYSELSPSGSRWMELSMRAVMALLTGKHAKRVGGNADDRIARLLEIAAAYTARELVRQEGVGASTATEIETWVQSKGISLRRSGVSVSSAMLRAQLASTPAVAVDTPVGDHRSSVRRERNRLYRLR